MQQGQDDRKESPQEKQEHLRKEHIEREREVRYKEQWDPWPYHGTQEGPKWYSIELADPPYWQLQQLLDMDLEKSPGLEETAVAVRF
jgi:hypothetical protein